MSEHVQVTGRPKRSPSYPALDLGVALQRAEELYRAERQNAVPMQVAIRHWGYTSQSGRSNSVVSALKKYGLIVDSGSGRARKVQVTDATRRILEHPDAGERLALIQKAALLPRMHNEMWKKYGADMPSDSAWAWELKEELDFTDVGAVEFIKEYRETIKFAQLGGEEAEDPVVGEYFDDDLPDPQEVFDSAARSGFEIPRSLAESYARAESDRSTRRKMTSVNIPIPGGGVIVLHGAFPISEANWEYLETVLRAMKPGLVASNDEPE
ncbi:MAG: hypothetical protein KF680_03585 [Cryobacterium sp.]|nr:hypothetical protein [Cryobacterium sp.]